MLKKIAHESVFAKPWFIYPIPWAAERAAQGSLSPAFSRALQGHSRSDCQPRRSRGSWLGVCLWVPNPRSGKLQLHPQPLSVSGHYAGFLARCLRSLSGAREGGTALDRHCAPSPASFPRLHRELLTQELGLALQCCQTNPTRTWQGPFSPPLPPVFRKCLVFSCHSDFNPAFKFY